MGLLDRAYMNGKHPYNSHCSCEVCLREYNIRRVAKERQSIPRDLSIKPADKKAAIASLISGEPIESKQPKQSFWSRLLGRNPK